MSNAKSCEHAVFVLDPHRQPIRVTHILRLPCGTEFPICPACGITLEREYQLYCDRCGQCLSWVGFSKAQIVCWAPPKSREPKDSA